MTTKTNQTTQTTKTETTYDPTGTFVWFELRTSEPKKSLAFFTEALGWKTKTMNVGQGDYTMLVAGETPVGGVDPKNSGAASFISYLAVPDVDAAAKRVEKAGGKVIGEPFDIPTIGRSVEVRDADGAAFYLYKSANPPSPDAKHAGTFSWNELWATDDKRAISFLTSVVGYSVQSMPMPGMDYHLLATKNGPAAGVMKSPVTNIPSSWLPYVHVENADATVARAKKLGAKVEAEAMDIPDVGRFAILVAPDGARFGVITPAKKM